MKPSDFFFGAMDFFAILLPGVVLTFLLSPWSSAVFGPMLPRLNSEAEQWIAFAICSYFFGHLLHQLGSLLDNIYDTHYVGKKRRFGEENLLKETRQLVKAELGEKSEGLSMFSWAGSYVRAHNSAAGAELERAGVGRIPSFSAVSACLPSLPSGSLCCRGNCSLPSFRGVWRCSPSSVSASSAGRPHSEHMNTLCS